MHSTRHNAAARRGFTAIELSAVVTIIAILVLILTPIVRNRVEEAKVAAARDDMWTIEKAQMLAYGYTGQFYRLQDLWMPKPQAPVSDLPAANRIQQLRLALPRALWDRRIPSSQLLNIYQNFNGPFMSPPGRSETIEDLIISAPVLFRGQVPDTGAALPGGPILVLTANAQVGDAVGDLQNARGETFSAAQGDPIDYPVDPWGLPYIYFGPNMMDTTDGDIAIPAARRYAGETDFSTSLVFTLGPDGLPGLSADGLSAAEYFPLRYWVGSPAPLSHLGADGSDDIVREF